MSRLILKKLTEEEKKRDVYHKLKVAYDNELNTLILIKDYTDNMSEEKCGLTWLEINEYLEIVEYSQFDSSGYYEIEFIAWGWQETDTEAGYGDGDADDELIEIEYLGEFK